MTQPPSPLTMLFSRHTRRREFISLLGGSAVAWPLATRAQQQAMPVVGWLFQRSVGGRNGPQKWWTHFDRGLTRAGFVEGRNLRIEERWARGDYGALPALAAEFVAMGVVAIAATGDVASARAAQHASSTVPVVFTIGGDPVRFGLVKSLNRPGGTDRHPLQPECPRRQARRAPPGNCPKRFPRCAADESHQSQCRHRTHGRRGRSKETGPGNCRAQCQNARESTAFGSCWVPRPMGSSPGPIRFRWIDASRSSRSPTGTSSRSWTCSPVRSGRWAYELWPEHQLDVSPSRRICWTNSQGRESGGSAGRAADQVRVGDQPQDREGARPHRAAHAASSRRRGDRIASVIVRF